MIIGFIVITSCEKEIDIDIPEKDRKIVINSLFNSNEEISVNISKSLNILDVKEFKFLDNATVRLFENGNFIENLLLQSKGNYESTTFIPSTGNSYKLEVNVPDMQSATATTIIPELLINNLTIDTNMTLYEDEFYSSEALECNIGFTDLSENKEYYWFYITGDRYDYVWDYNYETGYDTITKGNIYFNSDDPIIESWVSEGLGFVFSDRLFNGSDIDFTIYLNKYMYYELDTNILEFNIACISKDFYLYAATHNSHLNAQDNPFTEPVQVYTNVENGYGIFAGYSSLSDSIAIHYDYDDF